MQNVLSAIAWSTIVIGQATEGVIPEISGFAQAGALGVLAWVVWIQRQDAREERELVRKARELELKEAHDDREALNKTLTELRIHCASHVKESVA
jgi:hypothetical protein